jgi:hypothetical protein
MRTPIACLTEEKAFEWAIIRVLMQLERSSRRLATR